MNSERTSVIRKARYQRLKIRKLRQEAQERIKQVERFNFKPR